MHTSDLDPFLPAYADENDDKSGRSLNDSHFPGKILKGISLNTDEVARLAHLGRHCNRGWKASLEGFPAVLLWREISPYEAEYERHHVLH